DFRGHDEPSDLKQLVRGHVSIADDVVRVIGTPQTRIVVRQQRSSFPELLDEDVVFADEQVMEEAEPDGPVVRKCRRLLTGPGRVDRITSLEHREIAVLLAGSASTGPAYHQELRWVGGITLYAS